MGLKRETIKIVSVAQLAGGLVGKTLSKVQPFYSCNIFLVHIRFGDCGLTVFVLVSWLVFHGVHFKFLVNACCCAAEFLQLHARR